MLDTATQPDSLNAKPVARPAADERLTLDGHTWKDLEIFEARGEGPSVFGMVNLTRTRGGEAVLRARMERPWSTPDRIRDVQESIRYVIRHRAAFDCLPSEVVAKGVTDYLNGGLPVVASANPVVAAIEAFTIRFGEWRYYFLITQGVLRTTKMVSGLRRMLDPARLPNPVPGELAPLLEEMRSLLSRPAFKGVPELESWSLSLRTTFTLDRGFRSREGEALRRLVWLMYRVDALVAMADASSAPGMSLPEVVDGPATLEAEGLVNLFLAEPIPADVRLGRERHMLFLTGPNMAGKTTFLRSLGVATYLAHLGMAVPARLFRFAPSQTLLAALNISDDIHGGVSFFRAEAIRMKAIATALNAGRRVVALVDEPFKGTNVKDAMDASWLVLEAFADSPDCIFAVSSHLIELGEALARTRRAVCARFEAEDNEAGLSFDFTLREGVSSQRLGMRVLEQEGLVAQLRDRSGRRTWP